MSHSLDKKDMSNSPNFMDEKFKQELIETFLLEFEELLALYIESLQEIRKPNGHYKHAYSELFRIYHTLKGDSSYFPEFSHLSQFVGNYCEKLRIIDESQYKNEALLKELSLNFSRLSAVFSALKQGKSLGAFNLNPN